MSNQASTSKLAAIGNGVSNGKAKHERTTLPTTARLIALMLASQGVEDADERVLHQLMDFAHRYTTSLLTDARAAGIHARPGSAAGASAGNTSVEMSDVELAVQGRSGWEFTEGAPKDYLLPLAKNLNKSLLPTLSQSFSHISLPPTHTAQSLTNISFNLVPNQPPPPRGEGLYEPFAGEEEWGSGSEDAEGEEDEGDDGEGEGQGMEVDLDDEVGDAEGEKQVEEDEAGVGAGVVSPAANGTAGSGEEPARGTKRAREDDDEGDGGREMA